MTRWTITLGAAVLAASCSPAPAPPESPGEPETLAAAEAPAGAEHAAPDAAAPGATVEVERLRGETEAVRYDITFDDGLSILPALYERLRNEEIASARAFAEAAATDHAAHFAEPAGWEWRPYSLDVRWDIVWADDVRVSLLRSWHVDTGGAHPNHGLSSLLWNAETSAEVRLEDIFEGAADGSPVMQALRDAVVADLLRQKAARQGEYFDADREREFWLQDITPGAVAFPAFTLAPSTQDNRSGGLIIHYEPYAVGAYAEGPYRVLVPNAVFSDWLTPEWAAVFQGEPGVSPADLDP